MAEVDAGDWVARVADDVVAEWERRPGTPVLVCASGISPSGPIHLGNLREIMVQHFVADEVSRRGLPSRHLLSWDDYDRLRKVPAGVDPSFAEYVGRPLTGVPDPCGEHENWAEHFKAPFRAALRQLGVVVDEISQTAMYTGGRYREQVVTAMRARELIGSVLGRYRTKVDQGESEEGLTAQDTYYPYKVYCAVCRRDDTTIVSFDDETTEIRYTCVCGHSDRAWLDRQDPGKLVWKVDWPMRWAYEQVLFEAAGVDHSSPGSSYTVGGEVVDRVYGGKAPVYRGYSFVGTKGAAKLSGSAGAAPTPDDALRILEPALVRWLYVRRRPNQSITVAFDQEVSRLYDEWDALVGRVRAGSASEVDAVVLDRSWRTAEVELPQTARPMSFRTLASVYDITAGTEEQTLRILRDMTPQDPVGSLDEVRPRLDRAADWVATHVSPAERTQVRSEPDRELLASLDPVQREGLRLLVDGLVENWTLDGLTALVYGVPKQQLGLPLDTAPSPELRAAQRAFFGLVYRLLVHRDTGPRLPTLLLALGADQVRALLTPQQADATAGRA
ncbi:lysine--tRNA ligase [Micromonospora sp. NPDC047793]|uniref:lysine--tRNA ligase n=1 Tax=unclassified Micromonospora TaxID=2617518 RepID=UPI0033E0A27C